MLTTTTSTNFLNATFDPGNPADLNGDGLVDPGYTDASTALAGVAAVGADVDVVLIDGGQFSVSDPLLAVDPDGIDVVTNAESFGLESLIGDSSGGSAATVVSVTVNGTDYGVTDENGDPSDGFQFTLAGIPENPDLGNIDPADPTAGVFVNIDTDGDTATFEQVIDVTADLVSSGADAFDFDLQLT